MFSCLSRVAGRGRTEVAEEVVSLVLRSNATACALLLLVVLVFMVAVEVVVLLRATKRWCLSASVSSSSTCAT